eukprot:TRINITY_DN3136_c0_g1_i4.p1 TRINITY_DN3136_c0_g1~~TRINITY_DN3136_c0_g1_i4.p1  ORF type:complete len:150 (+),score=5.09 TRINITY_DN3136_c0_g1_i4:139-588(+)
MYVHDCNRYCYAKRRETHITTAGIDSDCHVTKRMSASIRLLEHHAQAYLLLLTVASAVYTICPHVTQCKLMTLAECMPRRCWRCNRLRQHHSLSFATQLLLLQQRITVGAERRLSTAVSYTTDSYRSLRLDTLSCIRASGTASSSCACA